MRWIGRHAPRPPGHIHQPVHLPAVPVLARAVVIGRMPGWQIAPIAAAAPAAVTVTMFVDRVCSARKTHADSAGRMWIVLLALLVRFRPCFRGFGLGRA